MISTLLTTYAVGCTKPTFFGLKPWYYYLSFTDDCNVSFTVLSQQGHSSFVLVLLAVVDDLLRVAALVAIAFIIYGGILYTTSQGSPDQTQRAQNSIQNALIGLVLCILSIAAVAYFGNELGS